VPVNDSEDDHLDTLSKKETNMEGRSSGEKKEDNETSSADREAEEDLEKGENENEDPDALEREEEYRKQKEEQAKDPNLIEWNSPDDPENPMNWKTSKKWVVTLVLGSMTFCVTFASSVFSNATIPVAEEFGVSTEVTTLGTSLFVLGFGVGPLVCFIEILLEPRLTIPSQIWGPGSELFGRKLPLFLGYAAFAIFQIPVAVAQNLETIMLCRFLGGCFASAPLAIVGGALADFFGPVDRGIAVCVFAAATFIGPIAGPIMGLVLQSHICNHKLMFVQWFYYPKLSGLAVDCLDYTHYGLLFRISWPVHCSRVVPQQNPTKQGQENSI
jgi:DHA1 family multidrug resistance protein-like MFS transporter